jgi:Flp pilus assembly protein TadD
MMLPEPHRQAAAGTVPVSELRNPPSKKTLSVIGKARRATDAGDHETAVRELSQAAQKNPNDGYLRTNLGVEYLRVGNLAAAMPLLEEAARLIPDSPKTHGNLAYAYYLNRDWTRAETEARAALAADRSDPRMRFLLGACLLARGSMDEALANLRAARDAIPEARAMLAKDRCPAVVLWGR